MFTPHHYGLFFSQQHVDYARKHVAHAPIAAAFNVLRHATAEGAAAAQLAGLRYRFLSDLESGEIALTIMDALFRDFMERPDNLNLLRDAVILAQCIELLRDHPAAHPAQVTHWQEALHERTAALNDRAHADDYLETLWMGLANMATGVVLEREPLFERGAQVYRDAIAHAVSPRGHIEPLTLKGETSVMLRMVLGVEALVMMAELAAQVGVDLWRCEVRGVSVMTCALYPMYYFYVTDKWKWEAITPEEVQAAYRAHGGYLEIINKRYTPRDIKPLLEDLRPIHDPLAGGVPTLSHGIVARRGLFG